MTLTLDVRRIFRSTPASKAPASTGTLHFAEGENLKARHILGLDSTCMNAPSRDDSASSTATSKPRGVTFSDATTAVVSAGSTADETDEGYASGLRRKGSSLLVKRNRKTDLQNNSLRPQVSDSSLRSFYDKSRIPLSVSQQTSDSSSRDFALRRGAPSVISNSSQEKEHIKQLRLLSKNHKSPGDRRKQLANEAAPSRASSLRSTASSIFEHNSNAEGSQVSKPSTARISITRMPIPESLISPLPINHSIEQDHPYAMVKTPVDPTQARINVRRPKVGTRNWFDNIDSDSSEGENDCPEPRLDTDFTVGMEDAYENGHVPSRIPSTALNITRAKHIKKQDQRLSAQQDAKELLRMAEKYELLDSHHRRKRNPFEAADLTHQSLLWLSSSEDSDNDSEQQHLRTPKTKIRDSLVNVPWDDSEIVYGKATIGAKSPEVVVKDIRTHGINANIPKRKGSKLKLQTYLEDESTTTLTQHDLLTSFPETPVDDVSRAPSLRESMLSESESMTGTKLMTVTRQEETLLAAMRMKKIAMKKARAMNDRKDALRVLEQNAGADGSIEDPLQSTLQKSQPQASRRQSAAMSKRLSAVRNASRQDSVTTIQTDSMAGQSVRSSIATYLSEGSEDLQLPYSSIYGLPMGSSVIRPSPSPGRRREPRDTFLSEMTVDSTITALSGGERSGSTRDSHVVLLDPIDRQMLLREDIPSQLFLEPPYVGWSIQAAH